jgi:uncharacterized phage protein gp47/JayE
MPRFQPKRQEQILPQMVARVVARTGMSDVADSSVVKHILAAAARSDDDQYYQITLLLLLFSIDTATGEDLDERAKDIQPAVIKRRQATKAVGTVVFTRNGTSGTVAINVGTRVKTAGGVVFATTTPGSIFPTSPEQIAGHGVGRDSGPVSVIAVEPGSEGRVAAGTIIKFDTKPPGVDAVTNPSPFITGGEDKESDDSFRNRLKAFVSSLARCTAQAIEVGVAGAQDLETGATILFAKVVEDVVNRGKVTLYVDDGTGSAESIDTVLGENVTLGLGGPPPNSVAGGEANLYLDQKPIKDSDPFVLTSSVRGMLARNTGAGGDFTLNPANGQIVFNPTLVTGEVISAEYTFYTGLIALAQKIVDGDPNDRENFPGFRAAGVLVRAQTPQVLLQNIEGVITVAEGFDQGEAIANTRKAIKGYVNNLPISGDLIRAELIKRIMSVQGVINVDLVLPATDIIILDDQLARTTDTNILVT